LFSEIVLRAQNVFIDSANLLKKLSFPRLCLPAVIIGSALVNFAIIFGLFSVFLIASGNFPGLPFLGLIPLLVILVIFSIGLGITVGVLNVFFRMWANLWHSSHVLVLVDADRLFGHGASAGCAPLVAI
jgi:lipopolysaccharide transport system permease protein